MTERVSTGQATHPAPGTSGGDYDPTVGRTNPLTQPPAEWIDEPSEPEEWATAYADHPDYDEAWRPV